MKKAVWVLENIKKSEDFYDELTIAMLIASICSWRKHNSTINTLYCDSMTFKKLDELGLLFLWHHVDTSILDTDSIINKGIFWASSKNRVLLEQTDCVSVVDVDFIAYESLSNIGTNYDVVCTCDEDGLRWYPEKDDAHINKMVDIPAWLMPNEDSSAVNVSYLRFNNLELQREYAYYSVKAMEELTILRAPFVNRYMVWAEQKLLKQFINHKQMSYKPLISNLFSCITGDYFEDLVNQHGEWTYDQAISKFYHIGQSKPLLRAPKVNLEFLYVMCTEFLDTDKLKKRLQTS